ncbi:B- and T-lymphocyte attenuator isoform X1 [Hippoglossus hippoglossus]|uniref:B- and T-lymphocyte attenuator isoform X1 n=1 Tax=Hippoglossus hippoglossus TaxID=8267 RepID=UPI00148E1541|nr:B- and T-lymphocyte attenuator isoform X1 [Hippoglossus hippoglossus]
MNMDRTSYTYLMIFYILVPIYGRTEGLFPSCRVGLMVRRGTALKRAPHQPVTISCPVKHCGKSVNVSWCKILDTNICERIRNTQNVEIRQRDDNAKNELVSILTFKWISAQDGGLYRCDLKGYGFEEISHTINISVSDKHKEAESTHKVAVEPLSAPGDEAEAWLPYFYICAGIALVVFTLSAFTLLSSYGWKQILTHKSTKGKETSTRTIPDLPMWSAPSSPVMFVPSDIHSPGTPPYLITNGNQPLAKAADERKASLCAVYATVDHTQAGRPVSKQHAASEEDKAPQYAAVNVS